MSPAAQAEQDPNNANNHLHHQTYVELYHHGLHHIKSSALLCVVGLGIPGAIHRRGGAATISDLVTSTGVHPAKHSHLRRLMRMLTCFGIFGVHEQRPAAVATAADDDGESETVYTLTPVSSVLVGNMEVSGAASVDMSALLRLLAHPSTSVSTFFSLEEWFKDGGTTTLFETALGVPPWSFTKNDAAYNEAMNEGCAVDTSFAMDIMLKDTCRGGGVSSIFGGLTSLVDVGGGHGAAAMAIAAAFPHIKCSVLDLEQVIIKVPRAGTDHARSMVKFIAGDMFESIPAADAVFLRNVLDCWDDGHCVKILRQCKRAIPSRDAGGKVIIMNAVVGYGSDKAVKETQVLFDMSMMRYGGCQREEHEWRKIFAKAGFSDYKITPIPGFHSIIEVFNFHEETQ